MVKPSDVEGEVDAQPSKSYTHRLLSIALLADGESVISNPLRSLDTKSTLRSAEILGAKIEETDNGWRVEGTGGNLEPGKSEIDVGNSGTTLRLMTAISTLSTESVRLTGDESILKRPMGPLVDSLKDLGARARCEGSKGRPPVVVEGPLEGGETNITGTVSSQFISALLISAPYSEVGADIEVEDELRSKPYVKMTLKTLELSDVELKSGSSLMEFHIPGEQTFSPFDHSVPGDFSSASFILGAGALSEGWTTVNNLDPGDVQGD
ncbi:MAG: 3-phosphoshikimate 1-carboxyvinyltransferase, partial [Candidatus Aenigmatarchaeota archaeon]